VQVLKHPEEFICIIHIEPCAVIPHIIDHLSFPLPHCKFYTDRGVPGGNLIYIKYNAHFNVETGRSHGTRNVGQVRKK
jgi:hypothetical protein